MTWSSNCNFNQHINNVCNVNSAIKRRENSHNILFYKIINNLIVVQQSSPEKADVRTKKKHSQKFRHIG